MNYDCANEMFQLAVDLVNQSSRNIFLTGKAGTGKTTFLKYIRENCPKQLAVVAPTGVAAINAGGVTIHSFFQLPLSPFVPGTGDQAKSTVEVINRQGLVSRLRYTKEKIKMFRQLELVIIDEISMVRCDTMDAIDTVLRFVRKRPLERFGGVQMLLIGDLFQLPPVIKEPEWQMLSGFYTSPYFFDSAVIRADPPAYIEFNKIYRQSEERFISLLNQVRTNTLDHDGMTILEERFKPSYRRTKDDGYIILATHNETAREVNNNELTKLTGRIFEYKAELEGELNESAYPADAVLRLKIGAQVMFIRNDGDKDKRYFNGKLGVVTDLTEDKITVRCKDEQDEIDVGKEEWKNIRYSLNKSSGVMEEEVLGSFTQYPLRLAWAITIHKSQGLTFEKAIIDAGEAFATGQVYVALSRCTSLDGMILKSKVRSNSLFTDQRIVEYTNYASSSNQLRIELAQAKRDYQKRIVLSLFDFGFAVDHCKEMRQYLVENKESFNMEAQAWVDGLADKLNQLQETANKFQLWFKAQFESSDGIESDNVWQERSIKAAGHFIQEMVFLSDLLQSSPATTDSRQHAKEYNDLSRELFIELCSKKFLLAGCNGKFDSGEWHKRKREFVLPAFAANVYSGTKQYSYEGRHAPLYQQLKKLRDAICLKRDLPIYMVAGSKSLDEMVTYLPQSLEELRKISGFGEAKVEKYGQQFVDIIVDYATQNNLASLVHEKLPKKERKPGNPGRGRKTDTKAESLRIYQQGKSIGDIAQERGLSVQTIEGHLCHYVALGEIDIKDLVGHEKMKLIESAVKDFEGGSIMPIKEQLGNVVGFGEIRLVLAWQQYIKGRANEMGLSN